MVDVIAEVRQALVEAQIVAYSTVAIKKARPESSRLVLGNLLGSSTLELWLDLVSMGWQLGRRGHPMWQLVQQD